ncbi:hypothetical protein NHG32_08320 [Aerococcaceae bacterium NML191219]|nr:hypothetical protein [Aerococcaceae bacterium NML191219]
MARRLISSLSPESKMKYFYVIDGMYFVGYAATTWMILPFFNQVYMQVIFGCLMGILFLMTVYRPKGNPLKRNIDVLWLFVFKRDTTVYYSVYPAEIKYFETDLNEEVDSENVIDTTRLS